MAGIGFQLARVAREGGVGGIAGAAAYGAVISAGPWLITAVSMELLEHWAVVHLGAGPGRVVQPVLIYAFSLSALAAAPIGIVATRMVADRIFARDAGGIPGIMLAALVSGGASGLVAGAVVFGVLARLPLLQALLGTLTLAQLTQIWIAAPLLTALRRYHAVPGAYLLGILAAAAAVLTWPHPTVTTQLAVIAGGVGLTLAAIVLLIRRQFSAPPELPSRDAMAPRLMAMVAAAGVASVAAIWIDKWILWAGPGSVHTIGLLRLNPINDQGSFLGLLTLVPGLTLLLMVTRRGLTERSAT